MPYPSTFSIVACDLKIDAWGIAVASKFPAVGSVVPWAQVGAGAIATQAAANTSFGPRGLEMLTIGTSAEETLGRLLANDPERENRQVGIVDKHGGSATYSGKSCNDWAGGANGPGYAIQGNILVSDQVVPAMQKAFQETDGELPERLYAALFAGDKAGGDRRGRQSAAIYVVKPQGGYGGFIDRWIDYRVDDHFDPVTRLGDLLQLHRLYFGKSPESERLVLSGNVLSRLQEIMKQTSYYHGPALGQMDETTRIALNAFMGNENFEERCNVLAGWIDSPVFDFLVEKFGNHYD